PNLLQTKLPRTRNDLAGWKRSTSRSPGLIPPEGKNFARSANPALILRLYKWGPIPEGADVNSHQRNEKGSPPLSGVNVLASSSRNDISADSCFKRKSKCVVEISVTNSLHNKSRTVLEKRRGGKKK